MFFTSFIAVQRAACEAGLICENNRLNKKHSGRTQTNSYDKIIRKFGMKKYINLNVIIILQHVDRHVFVTMNLV
jgi:hypothetical protein